MYFDKNNHMIITTDNSVVIDTNIFLLLTNVEEVLKYCNRDQLTRNHYRGICKALQIHDGLSDEIVLDGKATPLQHQAEGFAAAMHVLPRETRLKIWKLLQKNTKTLFSIHQFIETLLECQFVCQHPIKIWETRKMVLPSILIEDLWKKDFII